MVFLCVGQLRIDLIGNDVKIFLNDNLCDLLQILPLHDRTGRVIRERQYQDLGLRRNLL